MSISTLYLLGNGFDLHHGIKSSYWDFRTYLVGKNNDLVDKLESYFGPDALWSDFEETLAELDAEQIVEECMDYLQPYSAEDWSDAYHHDYQYEIQKRIDTITVDLKNRFTEWVLQLSIPNDADEKMISLNRDALFISFNYTSTLERLYRIPYSQIIYIHNKAVNTNSNLILGHSRDPNHNLRVAYNDEDTDVRVAEGNGMLDQYFRITYKSTGQIIQENSKVLDSLSSLKEIYVLGHSLSPVDLPYFEEIIKRIDKSLVQWKVSYFNQENLIHHQEVLTSLGIPQEHIEYNLIQNFNTGQVSFFSNENL